MRQRRLEAKSRVIARTFLEGLAAPVETCFALASYTFTLSQRFSTDDKNFITFGCSEADHLPVGKLKELWHPDFIGDKLIELARFDEQIRGNVKALCEAYLARYQDESAGEAEEV